MAEGKMWLSRADIMTRFGIGKDTLSRWRRESGFPPPVPLGGNTKRWEEGEVNAWAERWRAASS